VIAEDIKLAVKTMTSGKDVAAAFDARFAFDWTRYKGNASAEKCGMSTEEFKLVRDARTEYRDAWNNATDETETPLHCTRLIADGSTLQKIVPMRLLKQCLVAMMMMMRQAIGQLENQKRTMHCRTSKRIALCNA
jgi:hypothetical protein